MDDQNISGPIGAPTAQPPAADQLTEIEKQMTGFERATLRWTKAAVFMSFLAAGFVCLQWIEMRNGATDTHTLAVAAKTQAEKMSSMSDAAEKIRDASQNLVAETKKTADSSQKAIQESNRQSRASLDATIANGRLEQRAWVAELAMQMDAPEVGKIMHGNVTWANSGRTFAKKVAPRCHFTFLPEPVSTEDALLKLVAPAVQESSIGVLAPNSQYKTPLATLVPITEDDKSRIGGSWHTYIWGELSYIDIFGRSHSTIFCSSRQGSSGDFIQCPFHNDAN